MPTRRKRRDSTARGRRALQWLLDLHHPSSGADPDKVTATCRNGVLELHVPKAEQAQGRRIPIQGQQAVSGPAKGQPETPAAQGGEKKAS